MDREPSGSGLAEPPRFKIARPFSDFWPAERVVKAGRAVLDVLLPPQCPITGELVDQPGALSGKGWAQLQFIDAPSCDRCGLPFPYDPAPGGQLLCGVCARKAPAYDHARAALVHSDASARLILRFKYGDRTDGVAQFCRWMMEAGRDLWDEHDVLVPVPLHYGRLVRRRFNQAAVLASGLTKITGLASDPFLIKRRRATPQQKGLGYQARRRNVQGAFAVEKKRHAGIRDGRFVLVDDVLTSGATIEACARLLKGHGAQKVSVVTIARVVSEQKIPI